MRPCSQLSPRAGVSGAGPKDSDRRNTCGRRVSLESCRTGESRKPAIGVHLCHCPRTGCANRRTQADHYGYKPGLFERRPSSNHVAGSHESSIGLPWSSCRSLCDSSTVAYCRASATTATLRVHLWARANSPAHTTSGTSQVDRGCVPGGWPRADGGDLSRCRGA